MRIGLLTGEFPPMRGGIADYVTTLSEELTAQGESVVILSQPPAKQQASQVPLAQVTGGWGIGSLLAIRRWVRDYRLDIVNLHFQTAAFDMSPWMHALPHVLDVPLVTTFHDLRVPYLFPKAGKLRQWAVRHLARASDGVVVTNYADRATLSDLAHIAMIPITNSVPITLPHDYDVATYRQRTGAGEDDFLLAFFGFLNHSKGGDTLLQALQRVRERGIPARLVFVGDRTGSSDATNYAYAQAMDAIIMQAGLSDVVTETGYLSADEVSAYLRAADAVVLPFRDGASYRRSSLITAIHHGCAIITTMPQHAIPDLTPDHMELVAPDTPSALADAIERLYTSPSRLTNLRQQVQTLGEQFQRETTAAQLRQFFRQVIGGAADV